MYRHGQQKQILTEVGGKLDGTVLLEATLEELRTSNGVKPEPCTDSTEVLTSRVRAR
jgi:hypothetical protein